MSEATSCDESTNGCRAGAEYQGGLVDREAAIEGGNVRFYTHVGPRRPDVPLV
jgi:hypothetical protein